MRHAHFERNDPGNCVFVSYWPDIADAGIPDLGPGYVHIIEAINDDDDNDVDFDVDNDEDEDAKCQTIHYCLRVWEVDPRTSPAYRL